MFHVTLGAGLCHVTRGRGLLHTPMHGLYHTFLKETQKVIRMKPRGASLCLASL